MHTSLISFVLVTPKKVNFLLKVLTHVGWPKCLSSILVLFSQAYRALLNAFPECAVTGGLVGKPHTLRIVSHVANYATWPSAAQTVCKTELWIQVCSVFELSFPLTIPFFIPGKMPKSLGTLLLEQRMVGPEQSVDEQPKSQTQTEPGERRSVLDIIQFDAEVFRFDRCLQVQP